MRLRGGEKREPVKYQQAAAKNIPAQNKRGKYGNLAHPEYNTAEDGDTQAYQQFNPGMHPVHQRKLIYFPCRSHICKIDK
jgi:hypothetical protein